MTLGRSFENHHIRLPLLFFPRLSRLGRGGEGVCQAGVDFAEIILINTELCELVAQRWLIHGSGKAQPVALLHKKYFRERCCIIPPILIIVIDAVVHKDVVLWRHILFVTLSLIHI